MSQSTDNPQGTVVLVGIALFVTAMTCASVQAGMTKLLAQTMPFLFVVWGRFLVFFLLSMPITLWRHGPSAFRLPQPHLHFCRAILLLMASVFFIAAIRMMPLADAISVVFVYPFLVTALSPWVLKEAVPTVSWVAVASGFIGVIVVIRPSGEGVDWHALLALGAGCCFGIHLLITRRLTASTPPLPTALATALVSLLVLSFFVPFHWQWPDSRELAILIGLGIFGAASQLLTIVACNRVAMPTLAPFGYCEIIAATLVGLFLFGDFPDSITWIGITIIVASGLIIAIAAQRSARVQLISRTRPPAH